MRAKNQDLSRRGAGQAMVEFCLVAVIFLLPFVFGLMQFALLTSETNTLTNLARDGARDAAILGSTDPGFLPPSACTAAGKGGAQCAQQYLENNANNTGFSFANLNPVYTCTNANNGVSGACVTSADSSSPNQVAGATVTLSISYDMSQKLSPIWSEFGFFSNKLTKSATFVIQQ